MEVQQLEHIFGTLHTNFHAWLTTVALGTSNVVQDNVSQGVITENKLTNRMKNTVTISTHERLAYWPLEPEFVGSNPAEAVGFFGCPENPQYAFLQRGSKRICPMSQLCSM